MKRGPWLLLVPVIALGVVVAFHARPASSVSSFVARDPGVRGGPAGAGAPFDALTQTQLAVFQAGQEEFEGEEAVADGLGPTMNLDSCAGCHSQPAVGGTSGPANPQVAFATKNGATN